MNTLYIYIENSESTDIELMNDEQSKKHSHALQLKEKYMTTIEKHNIQLKIQYSNAGFDILNPCDINITNSNLFRLDTGIICAMYDNNNIPKGYYLYPRSSIIKTPLRLANSVGIIDSGYRGNIIGMFDVLPLTEEFKIERFSRLLQICSGNLEPFLVKLVDNLNDLGITERGSGGFGSTGN